MRLRGVRTVRRWRLRLGVRRSRVVIRRREHFEHLFRGNGSFLSGTTTPRTGIVGTIAAAASACSVYKVERNV